MSSGANLLKWFARKDVNNRRTCTLINLHTLALHGADTTVLKKVVNPKVSSERKPETHSKEDPLKHLAVIFWLLRHVEPQLVFGIVVLGQIKQDGGCLEDRETLRAGRGRSVPVHQDGNSAIRVQGIDEPRLLLPVGSERDVLDTDCKGCTVRYSFGGLVQTHSYATLSP